MATLIDYSQLSHLWKIATATVLTLMSAAGITPLVQHKNAAGIVVHKELSDGSSTWSGSMLIGSGSNKVLIGNTGNITMQGTMSGDTLHIEKVISNSGGIITETSISGATLKGFGLGSCSNSSTSKLLYNSSTNTFSCGTDQGTSYFAGRGLTLSASNSFSLNATITGSLVNFQTVSGGLLHANNTLSSSGGLVFEGSASGASIYVATSIKGAGLVTCNASNQVVQWSSTSGRFSCVTATVIGVGQGLSLSNGIASLNSTVTGSLVKAPTISGSLVYANVTLASSGTLVFEGAASGSSLYLGSQLNGAGLASCTGGNKLLWTGGRFSCAADANTNYTAAQGLTLTSTAFSVNGTLTGTMLRFLTISGSSLQAKTSLTSSGSLKVLANMSGATLNVNSLKTCTNVQTDANGRLSCNSTTYLTSDLAYTAGQGLTLTSASFKTNATLTGSLTRFTTESGEILFAHTTLTSSGGLKALGNISGATLNANSLKTCTNVQTDSNGRLSCNNTSYLTTPYTAGQGLTLTSTSFKVNSTLTGTLLRFLTASGETVFAHTTLTSSGGLKALGNISGSTLNVNSLQNCTNVQTNASGRASCNQTSYLTAAYTAGQGLTLTSTSFKVNSTLTGSLARFTTESGEVLFAHTRLTSSGGLKVLTDISGATLHINNSINDSGSLIVQGSSRIKGNENVVGTLSGGALTIMNGNSYLFGNTDIGSSTNADTKLEVIGTISGAALHITGTSTFSGSLALETSLTGATVTGFGLTDCANASTSKVLYTLSTGKFSCGTDQTTAATAGQGLTNTANSFKVNATLTGSLIRFTTLSGETLFAHTRLTTSGSLKVLGDMSGSTLHINLASSLSGSLTVGGSVRMKGAETVVGTISGSALKITNTASFSGAVAIETSLTGSTFAGFGLVDCDGAQSLVQWDITSSKFSCLLNAFVPTTTSILTGTGLVGGGTLANSLTLRVSQPGICHCRLSLQSGTAVTLQNLSGSQIWLDPYQGNDISLYNSTNKQWEMYSMTGSITLGLTLTSGKVYDVFASPGTSGHPTLSLGTAWTSDTVRATPLSSASGALVLSTDKTKLYVGSIYAEGTNYTTDSVKNRYVANEYNRVDRRLYLCPGYVNNNVITSYTTTSTTWTSVNGGTNSTLGYVSVGEDAIAAEFHVNVDVTTSDYLLAGLGDDITSEPLNSVVLPAGKQNGVISFDRNTGAGRHTLNMLYASNAGGTQAIYADWRAAGAAADICLTYTTGNTKN